MVRAFTAGFVATLLAIVFAVSRTEPPGPAAGHADALPTTAAARPPGRMAVQLAADCQRRIDALLSVYPLTFERRSEVLKPEVRQSVFGVLEILGDCPDATLHIVARVPPSLSGTQHALTAARIGYLLEQFGAGGVEARTIDERISPEDDDGGGPRLLLRVTVEPGGALSGR